MEHFKETVKPQTLLLNCLDGYPAYCTIPLYLYYGNADNSSQFMPQALLKDSFFIALEEFPFLAGHLRMKSGGTNAHIEVEPDNLNIPEYSEIDSDIHFSNLQASKFCWGALPNEIAHPPYIARSDKSDIIKLARISIVRLKDNSGLILLVNISHAVVDAHGCCAFLKHWAQICRKLASKASDNESSNSINSSSSSDISIQHERNYLQSMLPEKEQPLDQTTSTILENKTLTSSLLSKLSPRKRGAILDCGAAFISPESHIFYLSCQTLSALKKAASANSATTDLRISDNDIITAILSMVFIQCSNSQTTKLKQKISSGLSKCLPFSKGSTPKPYLLSIAVDCRFRLGNPEMTKYTGNCIITRVLSLSQQQLLSAIDENTIAACAAYVRRSVNDTNSRYVRRYVSIGESAPDFFLRLIAYMIYVPTRFCVSNQARMDYYNIDFGSGFPVWISPPKVYVPGYASVLPTRTSDGGCYVYLSVKKDAMARVLQHTFWQSIAELVY
ncbi:transferase [Coemansia spiralis]|nr:transferase [Coemansia spiralis]